MPTQFRLLLLPTLVIISLIVLAGCGNNIGCGTGVGSTGGPGAGSSTGVSSNSSCGGSNGGGGGNSGGGSTISAFLYYLGSSSDIQGASLNSSGAFANLNPYTPPVLASSVNSMAVANGQFLYIPMNGFSDVQGFSINRVNGGLTTISGSPFPAQAADDTLALDPNGRFLFVGGEFASSISVYQINATTGALTPAPGSPFQSFNLVFANSLTVDGTGKFLYVGQTFSTNPVVAFSIDQTTGGLTEITGSPFPLGVSVVQADPSGKFLLGVADNSGTSGDHHVYVYSINPSTGAPTSVSGSPFSTVSVPFALTIDPSGSFVYVSVADSNALVTSLEGYQLNTTSGFLTAMAGSPFTNLPIVAECQFDQSDSHAFCLNANGFSVLDLDPSTGNLSHTIPDLTTTNNFPFAVTN
jgi:6-phosphogluconolactonase (cycloisomerase 2 family)